MLQVRFKVPDHDDRLKMMEILQDNDYRTWTDTDYSGEKPVLYVTALIPESEATE